MTRVRTLHIATAAAQSLGGIMLAGGLAAETDRWIWILGVVLFVGATAALLAAEPELARRDDFDEPFRAAVALSNLDRTFLVQARLGGTDTLTFRPINLRGDGWEHWISANKKRAWRVSEDVYREVWEAGAALEEAGLTGLMPSEQLVRHFDLTPRGRTVADAWIARHKERNAQEWGPPTR